MSDYAANVWDDAPDWGGVGARRLVRAPGGSLNASIWEFQPGGSQFVYHFHHASEELLIVLRGRPTVRMHDGDRELADGDAVARVLVVAANADPDVAEYPETGKVAMVVGGQHRFHRTADAVDNAGP